MFPGVESNRWPYGPFEHKQGGTKTPNTGFTQHLVLHPNHIQKMMARYIPEMIVIHSNTKCWRCNNKNAKRTCLSVFCNYGWWHVDASQCTAARASFGRCCSLCRQIMGFISSFFQPQSVTWCLVSRHQQKTYIDVNKKLAQHKRDCLCIDTIDNQN